MKEKKVIQIGAAIFGLILWVVGIRILFNSVAFLNISIGWRFLIDFIALFVSFGFLQYIILNWKK